uniref:Uncharacterized protein n=1 Tax=Romanomermis culicivorax TaxID=13658 RepID=A0A915L8H0_ROMCU
MKRAIQLLNLVTNQNKENYNSMAARIPVKSGHLKLPALGIDGRYPTMNQMFSTSLVLRPEIQSFINIAIKPHSKVLDIGPAYGIVCLEALKCGAEDYWAVDLDERHLKILIQQIENDIPKKIDCVKLLVGKFPEDDIVQKLDYGTFDAIL